MCWAEILVRPSILAISLDVQAYQLISGWILTLKNRSKWTSTKIWWMFRKDWIHAIESLFLSLIFSPRLVSNSSPNGERQPDEFSQCLLKKNDNNNLDQWHTHMQYMWALKLIIQWLQNVKRIILFQNQKCTQESDRHCRCNHILYFHLGSHSEVISQGFSNNQSNIHLDHNFVIGWPAWLQKPINSLSVLMSKFTVGSDCKIAFK